MLEPSYREIMERLNATEGAQEVKSRYSIIIATARRARQLVDENDEEVLQGRKAITVAVDEIYNGKMIIKEQEN